MYTMYQSIRGDMTETAYLKMLDYWLLFCLLTPFIIFMIEVFWILKKAEPEKSKNWWYRKILDPVLKERFVKIFVPSITCLFMLSYTCAAVVIRNFQPWAMNFKQEYIMPALQVLRTGFNLRLKLFFYNFLHWEQILTVSRQRTWPVFGETYFSRWQLIVREIDWETSLWHIISPPFLQMLSLNILSLISLPLTHHVLPKWIIQFDSWTTGSTSLLYWEVKLFRMEFAYRMIMTRYPCLHILTAQNNIRFCSHLALGRFLRAWVSHWYWFE